MEFSERAELGGYHHPGGADPFDLRISGEHHQAVREEPEGNGSLRRKAGQKS